MITALVFDCFGVLYQGSRTYLYDRVDPARHQELTDLNHASDHGFVGYDTYLEQASELADLTSGELRDIFQTEHIRNQQLVAYIREVKQRCQIGLLSNVGPQVMEQLFPLREQNVLFDAVVLSCDVASLKPHPVMYETVLERLNAAPEDSIMIDDIQSNIDGAEMVGMHGVRFTSTEQAIESIRMIVEAQR